MSEQTPIKPQKIFNDPISVAKRAKQKVYRTAQVDKRSMLELIITSRGKALVVSKSKRGADSLSTELNAKGITASAVHANKSAQACVSAAKAFDKGDVAVLIATDTMMQSLNLGNIALLISYDLPIEPEFYLARVGTLGEGGEAISLVSPDEESLLYLIERTMRHDIPAEELEGFVPSAETPSEETAPGRSQKKKPRHKKVKEKTAEKKKKSAADRKNA
ncbi:MAG: ATP-dependent helicase [Campylobacterales bacterium]|nr:ATP-dependent helicase [Campylobacterales bacterium]